MKSEQEELNRKLTEEAFGTPLIFKPDNYMIKDSRPREPADLAWIANGGIILMWMKKKKAHQDIITNNKRFHDKSAENLKQAEGWLKEWRNGRALIGKNSSKSFHIKYEDVKNIIVLSIVDNDVNDFIFHEAFAQKHDIKLCVTLPQSAINYLTNKRYTIIDLMIILKRIKNRTDEDIETNALTIMKMYFSQTLNGVDPDRKWFNNSDEETNRISTYVLHNLIRTSILLINESTLTSSNIRSFYFNDMSLYELLLLIRTVRESMEEYFQDHNIASYKVLELRHYILIVSVGLPANLVNEFPKASNEIDRLKSTSNKSIILFSYMIMVGNLGAPTISFGKREPDESYFEILMKNWD